MRQNLPYFRRGTISILLNFLKTQEKLYLLMSENLLYRNFEENYINQVVPNLGEFSIFQLFDPAKPTLVWSPTRAGLKGLALVSNICVSSMWLNSKGCEIVLAFYQVLNWSQEPQWEFELNYFKYWNLTHLQDLVSSLRNPSFNQAYQWGTIACNGSEYWLGNVWFMRRMLYVGSWAGIRHYFSA